MRKNIIMNYISIAFLALLVLIGTLQNDIRRLSLHCSRRFRKRRNALFYATNEIISQKTPWLVLDSSEANADLVTLLEANTDVK